MAEPVNERQKPLREVGVRWTTALTKEGWTPVSDFFLKNYASLDPPMSNAEAMFVIHPIRHKCDASHLFPGIKTMAKRMGISLTAARAHARSLENKKYLNVLSEKALRIDLICNCILPHLKSTKLI